MSLGSSMFISASGLTAERLHMDVISNNIANVNTTRTAQGGPFRRQQVLFSPRQAEGFASALATAQAGQKQASPGQGVQVSGIEADTKSDFKVVYDPGHPDADAKGNVRMPNIEPVLEMVDLISASRSYEASVTCINTAKQMENKALEIGRG